MQESLSFTRTDEPNFKEFQGEAKLVLKKLDSIEGLINQDQPTQVLLEIDCLMAYLKEQCSPGSEDYVSSEEDDDKEPGDSDQDIFSYRDDEDNC